MTKLYVSFGVPDAGWIEVTLRHGAETVYVGASYIYNSFHALAEALIGLESNTDEAVVIWQCEPSEYEFRFSRQEDAVSLRVLAFPDSRRSVFNESEPRLSIIGSYDEVCLPFWRALRQLQGRFSEEEWQARWHSPFPARELDLLTAALSK